MNRVVTPVYLEPDELASIAKNAAELVHGIQNYNEWIEAGGDPFGQMDVAFRIINLVDQLASFYYIEPFGTAENPIPDPYRAPPIPWQGPLLSVGSALIAIWNEWHQQPPQVVNGKLVTPKGFNFPPRLHSVKLLELAVQRLPSQPDDELARRQAASDAKMRELVSQLGVREPVAKLIETEAPPPDPQPVVKLRGITHKPIVCGNEVEAISTPYYRVVEALLGAGADGLTKSDLERVNADAIRYLRNLRKSDDWKGAIKMAGKAWGRYAIVHA